MRRKLSIYRDVDRIVSEMFRLAKRDFFVTVVPAASWEETKKVRKLGSLLLQSKSCRLRHCRGASRI